jgi:hypothetical protein
MDSRENVQVCNFPEYLPHSISEDKLSFYESCSMEVLMNALDLFQSWKMLAYKYPEVKVPPVSKKPKSPKFKPTREPPADPLVTLLPPYQKESAVQVRQLKQTYSLYLFRH